MNGRRFALAANILLGAVLPTYAQTASDTWGQVTKQIVVHPGTTTSAWLDVDRSLVTNGPLTMTPVGDGTYEAVLPLVRGRTYNYLFFAVAGNPPEGGLCAGCQYYDPVPTRGPIPASTWGDTTVTDTSSAYYGQAGNFDARRILEVPASLAPGETMWIFNNFGETPGVVANLIAYPEGDTQIRLEWTGPYGFWGQGGEAFKAADVLAGGVIEIYRDTDLAGTFPLIATIDGSLQTYLDTGLVAGETYCYVLRAVDAYQGGPGDTFPQLRGPSSDTDCATTQGPIKTFWIVRDPDVRRIEEGGGLVFLSRACDPFWGPKVPARFVRIFLPRGLSDESERARMGFGAEEARQAGGASRRAPHGSHQKLRGGET